MAFLSSSTSKDDPTLITIILVRSNRHMPSDGVMETIGPPLLVLVLLPDLLQ